MTVYFVMLIIPLFFSLIPRKLYLSYFDTVWILVGIFFVGVVGLRYEVGGDWNPYLDFFDQAVGQSFVQAVSYSQDPGYFLFNWIFANSGFEIWIMNLFLGLIAVSGVMALAKRQPNPWLALTIAVPYMFIVVFMGYVRQGVALGLFCWALLAVEDKKPFSFIFFSLLAVAFHKSAIIVMPLFILTLDRIRLRHWLIIILLFSLALVLFVLESLDLQWTNYVEADMKSDGGLIRVAMNIPAALVVLCFGNALGLKKGWGSPWVWMAWASLICIILVNISSTVIDRIALYLLPLQLFVYGRLYRLFQLPIYKVAANLAVVSLSFSTEFIWLNYAIHANNWIPYKFYPLVGG